LSVSCTDLKKEISECIFDTMAKKSILQKLHTDNILYVQSAFFCSNSTFQPTSYQDNICRLLSVKFIQTCQKLSSQNGVNKRFILQQQNMVSVL